MLVLYAYVTNHTKARTRIEKGAMVVLFTSCLLFNCYASNLVKNEIKKCKMVQYLFITDL